MKLSILLVCYNQQEFIDECIEGILIQQTNEPFELIIADDCSTDTTVDQIRAKLEGQKFEVNFLETEKNLGLGPNYRRGIEACNGEFVALLEGDDYWTDPLRLQKHISFLEKNPLCPMSFNLYGIYRQNTGTLTVPSPHGDSKFDYYTSKTLIQYNVIGNLSTCVLRKSALDQIPKSHFDYDITDWFIGIFLAQNHPVAQLKEVMSVYRINDKGLWSRSSREVQIRRKEEVSKFYDYLLDYRYATDFLAFRLASQIKSWRDRKLSGTSNLIQVLLKKILSQGIIIRLSLVIAALSWGKARHKYPKLDNGV
ncbi:glycosyltransferase [uncultured Algoriphagus sp.]|uniref:glycosyltransferase family 2 protein n=1 Tax=uncultured Algoriphagus sp. TaxID=417365 RepID=UPI00259AD285|nr:glycosyltransferase [uncultured Algoriphagus sp.]